MPLTAELSREEEFHSKFNYLFAGAVAIFFTALIAPYREIHLPPILMVSLFFTLSLMCVKFVLDDFRKILILFAVYAPFQKVLPGDLGGAITGLNLTNVLTSFILIGWLSQSRLRDVPLYKRRPVDVPLLIFCFLSSTALIRGGIMVGASSIEQLAFPLKRWLLPMLMYYAFVNTLDSRETLKQLVVAICITTALIGILGVKEFYIDMGGLSRSFHSYRQSSIEAVCDQPNQLGAFFSYYTFYIAAFFLANIGVRRYWWLLPPILLCGRSLLLTFSRAGKVSFTAGGLALIYLWNRKVFYFVFVPVMLLLIAYPTMIPGVFVGRLGQTVQALGRKPEPLLENPSSPGALRLDPSAVSRLKVWKAGLQMVRDNPLVGLGFGQFKWQLGRYLPELDWPDPHNTYVQVATEMGLPALFVFLYILYALFRQGLFVYRRSTDKFLRAFGMGYLAGLAGLIVANLFGSRLNTSELVFQFWILSALIVRAREYTEEDLQAETAERQE